MTRFRLNDFGYLENASASPANLRTHIGEMIVNSVKVRARVESVNPETGEYRIVLQGTLDQTPVKWEED